MNATHFDPSDPDFLQNPYPVYAELRAKNPLFFAEENQLWFCTRYEDVDFFLRDRRFGRAIDPALLPPDKRPDPAPPAYAPFTKLSANSMFDMEPPDHTRLKQLVHKVFTPRRVNQLRENIQTITNQLLGGLHGRESADLLAEFAAPLPVIVIAELLGVPEADRHLLRPWSQAIVTMFELEHTASEAAGAIQAATEFSDYLRRLARQRRARPQADLISDLALVEEAGEQLSEDELIATCVLLLNAGHEATVNVIGNGLFHLLQHPDQLKRLQQAPALTATAVEEMMRYDTPLQLFRRWVLADVVYQGIRLSPGMQVGVMLGAANRDPAIFARPDQFDIGRQPNPHLAFGAGIHYCLGAPLARLELQIALETLINRYPRLALVEPAPVFRPKYVIRGLESLVVSGLF